MSEKRRFGWAIDSLVPRQLQSSDSCSVPTALQFVNSADATIFLFWVKAISSSSRWYANRVRRSRRSNPPIAPPHKNARPNCTEVASQPDAIASVSFQAAHPRPASEINASLSGEPANNPSLALIRLISASNQLQAISIAPDGSRNSASTCSRSCLTARTCLRCAYLSANTTVTIAGTTSRTRPLTAQTTEDMPRICAATTTAGIRLSGHMVIKPATKTKNKKIAPAIHRSADVNFRILISSHDRASECGSGFIFASRTNNSMASFFNFYLVNYGFKITKFQSDRSAL